MLCTECKQSQTTRQRTGGERKWASGTILGKQLLWELDTQGVAPRRSGKGSATTQNPQATRGVDAPTHGEDLHHSAVSTTTKAGLGLFGASYTTQSRLRHRPKKSLTGGGTTKHGAWQPQLPATRCLLSSANGVATTALSKTTARGVASTAPGVVSTSYGSGTSEAKLGQAF